MENGINNHWLEGTLENRKKLHYIAKTAIASGKAMVDLPLRSTFSNIARKAHNQSSFIEVVNQELDKLALHRSAIANNPFTDLNAPIIKAELAERFAIAYLFQTTNEEASSILDSMLNGHPRYYTLVNGVCWEYQKKILIKLRKLGYRNWEKHADQFKAFINEKITLNQILIKKPQKNDQPIVIVNTEGSNQTDISEESKGLSYFSFNCKEHITAEQLDKFHENLIRIGYYKKSSLFSGNLKDAAAIKYTAPVIWLGGIGRLSYLYTRLSEIAFELPEDVVLPPNALVKEDDLKELDSRSKIAEMKVFSRWMNKRLIKVFRNEKGEKFTPTQLKDGKKSVLKLENEDAKWKSELEDLLLILQNN